MKHPDPNLPDPVVGGRPPGRQWSQRKASP